MSARGNIRRAAAEALVAFMASRPEFQGVHLFAASQDYEQDMLYPSIVVLSKRMEFTPWQEDEVDESVPGKVLVRVGDVEGDVEIQCAALSATEREDLEGKVTQLFLERELSPGVIALQTNPLNLGGVQWRHRPVVSYVLGDEDWREEFVFDSERYTFMTVDASLPMYSPRDAKLINQLVLAINYDLGSDVPDEQRQVNEDGSTTTL